MMQPQRSSSIDVVTLLIAAAASAAAAFVTSQVWERGTLFSAAMTPVIVTLVKEALAKPVERVHTLRTERHTGEAPVAERDAPAGTGPMAVYRAGVTDKRFKVAVVTGLVAFAGVVALFTIPELVAGQSIGGGGKSGTTFFGGKPRKSDDNGSQGGSQGQRRRPGDNGRDQPSGGGSQSPKSTPTPQAERPTPTPTPEETATPEQTPTPTPTPTP